MKSATSNITKVRLNLDDLLTRLIVDLPQRRGIPKSQILREASVDITKYHQGGSQPNITSFVRVCDSLELCPGMVTLIACWVKQEKISYPQAVQILSHWPEFEHLLDAFQLGIFKLLDYNPVMQDA